MKFKISSILASTVLASLTASAGFADVNGYSQDFEGLVQVDPDALSNDGWLVFGNVFDSAFNYLYGYGPFIAPNGGPGFCGITSGQGGAPQGAQQLVVYSDYNNSDQGTGAWIEGNTFQEQIVDVSDVGNTFRFTFDAKMGDLAPASTALAFIKVIDNNTFGLSDYQTIDMTNIPTTWGTYEITATINAGQIGHFFQVGFSATSAAFTPSGVIYDNVSLVEELPPAGTPFCFGDGTGTACPCGNNSPNSGSGCDNGTGSGGATLSTTGSASIGLADMVFSGSGLEINQPGLYFQGDNAVSGGSGLTFGDGLRCAGGNVVRLQVRSADALGNSSTTINIGTAGGVSPGQTKRYQLWYRNPNFSACGFGFNLTNGVEFTWIP
jgi:hypothetical protein